MTLESYLDSIREKTVAVVGIGISNLPLIELLCRSGISVTACDKRSREELGETAERLLALGAELVQAQQALDERKAHPRLRNVVPVLLLVAAERFQALREVDIVLRREVEQDRRRHRHHQLLFDWIRHAPHYPCFFPPRKENRPAAANGSLMVGLWRGGMENARNF